MVDSFAQPGAKLKDLQFVLLIVLGFAGFLRWYELASLHVEHITFFFIPFSDLSSKVQKLLVIGNTTVQEELRKNTPECAARVELRHFHQTQGVFLLNSSRT